MRVLTYNIRGGLGMDGRRSTARIAEIAATVTPDIICFQEVHQRLPQSRFVDQPRRLQRLLQMPFVFQRNLNFGLGGYGLGIASRFPVTAQRQHLLPSVGEQRGALEVRLQMYGGPVTVFCTHWGLDSAERIRQARQLSEWVQAAPRPVIVCGDFNARPEEASLQMLLAMTGLLDADARQNSLTYPADAPTARIDYLFYSDDLTLELVETIQTLASDHLPLMADFAAGAGSGGA